MEHNYDTIDLYDLVRKIFQFLLRTWKAALPVLLLFLYYDQDLADGISLSQIH